MRERFEIAVIGAGPAGLSVGIAARQAGVGCTIFDKGCITRGISLYPVHMTFFSTAERLELGGVPFIVENDKPTRREALKYYRRVVEHFRLDVRQYEEVVEVTGAAGCFALRTRRFDGTTEAYAADNVVVATGYFDTPNRLGVPGDDLPKVTHYYREGHPYYDQECVVVGGGNSAVEAALDLYRSGARVTLIHFGETFDRGVKPWILPDITNRLEKGEIAVRWRTRIAEIGPRHVVLRSEETGALEELENDWVFAMTGYSPDPHLLRGLGVEIDPETGIPAHDPETLETNVPGVFVAGVLVAGNEPNKIFIENAREHGPRILAGLERAGRAAAGRRPGGGSFGP